MRVRYREEPISFADASGTYELVLARDLLSEDNPGNCAYDTWRLAEDTRVRLSAPQRQE